METLPTASLNLALIGNCAVSALVDPLARIVWCCMQRPDADPVFHALLDSAEGIGREGCMAVELEGLTKVTQAYEPGTAIVRTTLWDGQGGCIEVVDFAPRFRNQDRMFRPAQLVRRVRPIAGRPRVRFAVHVSTDWGAGRAELTRGSNHVRYVTPAITLRLNTNLPILYLVDETWFSLASPVSLLLGTDESLAGGVEDTARLFEVETRSYWRHWTARLAVPLEWQDAVIRAAITLKLCQFEETGAIIAAVTTSIPEAPNTSRNWDYRYCWLRDAFFVVRALNSLAEIGTMEDYLRWLQDVVRGNPGHVQPMFGVGLEAALPERVLELPAGYRGMGPVRVGNQAYEHFQHDVYGNIVLGAAQAFHDHRLLRRADLTDFEQLERMGEQAWALHDQPDAGMWELRTRAHIHTSSSLMCWAACDRLAKIAQVLHLPKRALLWARRAERIRQKILRHAWCALRGAFASTFDGQDLDASVLLMCEVGFIDARDPRFVSTLRVLEQVLCDGPYMRRYEAADDFGVPQVAFNACAFWRIDALARSGQTEEAREIFEAMLARRNPMGLLSEDLVVATGELWGNFPQTYSMVGIVNGAMRLSQPWEQMV